MEDDDNENTGNTTYKDKESGGIYTAAYIIVGGKGTTNEVDENLPYPVATAILNQDANNYNLEQNENLNNSTVIGYYISTEFKNTGSLTASWTANRYAVHRQCFLPVFLFQ